MTLVLSVNYQAHWTDKTKQGRIRSLARKLDQKAKDHGIISTLRNREAFFEIAESLLVNIVFWGTLDREVLVSRNKALVTRHHLNVLDTLEADGLILMYIAPQNPLGGFTTTVKATERLLMLTGEVTAPDVGINGMMELVELRDKDKRPLPLTARQLKSLSAPIKRINKINQKHRFTIDDVSYPAPAYRRVYSESLDRGGRWYAYIQQLPQVARQRIRIDGENTVELDYSSLHPRLIYAREGIQYDDDPYEVPGLPRDVAKIIFMTLLYDTSIRAARNHLKGRQNPTRIQAYEEYMRQYRLWEAQPVAKRPPAPERPKCLHAGFAPLSPSIDVDRSIDTFLAAHSRIESIFNNESLSTEIQYLDARISEVIFAKHHELKRPILGIHDSFIVQKRHENELYQIMAYSYEKVTEGFRCKIASVYQKNRATAPVT